MTRGYGVNIDLDGNPVGLWVSVDRVVEDDYIYIAMTE
jgi:hypothetical protein